MTTSNTKMGYGVVNTGYSQGAVGEIIDNGTPTINKEVVTQVGSDNLSGDPRVLAFRDAANAERALVVSYKYDPSTWQPGDPEFLICNPAQKTAGKWNAVQTLSHSDWSQLSNPYGIATIGSNMFVADYDNACIAKIDMSGNAYTQSSALFYPFPAITGYQSHCASIGLLESDDAAFLVALFNHATADYSAYLPSTLVLIDPDDASSAVYFGPHGSTTTGTLGQNAVSMTVTGNYAYVSSYGGMQQGGGNPNSKLQVVRILLSPSVSFSIINTFSSSSTNLGDFVGTAISGSAAYVLRANYTPTWQQYRYQVYPTTTSNLQTGTALPAARYYGDEPPAAGSGYPGVTWMVAAESSRVWFVCGDTVKGIDTANATDNVYDFNKGLADLGNSPKNGHLNTAAIVQHGVSNTAVQHPAFASRTQAALKLRKVLLEEREKKAEK